MTRNKNGMLNIFIFAIVGVVYNVIVFMLIEDHDRLFWISYIFTMIAIVMPIVMQFGLFREGDYPKRVFLSLPVVVAAFIYMIVQVVVGFVLTLLPDDRYKISVVVQLIILAVFAVFAIITLIVRNNAESLESNVREKRFYLQSLVTDLQGLADRTEDAVLKKHLKALSEAVRFSDSVSHESLAPLEMKIEVLGAELENLAANEDNAGAFEKIKEIEDSLAERNRKAKALKLKS
jgi:hypothetical protein